MNRNEIEDKVTAVFREIFQEPELKLSSEMTAHDVALWDSLSHVDMIVMVEEAFSIRMSTKKITRLKKVGELLDLIEKKVCA